MKKTLIVSLMVLASTANANNWTPIAEAKGKPVIGVDYKRSFMANNMPVIFWNDFTFGYLVSTKRPNNHPMTIYRTKIDCKNRMLFNQYMLSVEVTHFFDPAPSQYASPWNGPGEWFVPDSGSGAEFVMNHFCGFKNP